MLYLLRFCCRTTLLTLTFMFITVISSCKIKQLVYDYQFVYLISIHHLVVFYCSLPPLYGWNITDMAWKTRQSIFFISHHYPYDLNIKRRQHVRIRNYHVQFNNRSIFFSNDNLGFRWIKELSTWHVKVVDLASHQTISTSAWSSTPNHVNSIADVLIFSAINVFGANRSAKKTTPIKSEDKYILFHIYKDRLKL